MVKHRGYSDSDLGAYTEKMYAALGEALDGWGNVEAMLSAIFCKAMGPAQLDVASAAYSAIISFEVQLAITNATMQEAYKADKKVLADWKTVYKQVDKLRPLRNKLAHGRTIIVMTSITPLKHERRYLPFFHYYTHKDWRTFDRFKIEDLENTSEKFATLVQDLHAFGKSIGALMDIRQPTWKE